MPKPEVPLYEPLDTAAADRVEQACVSFERAWRAGQPPRLEDFVHDAPPRERAELIRELVLLDLEYRQRSGDALANAQQQYLARLPDAADAVVDALSRHVARQQDHAPRIAFAPSTWAASASDTQLEPADAGTAGREFGDYVLVEELGRGGMGVVYKAWQKSLERFVALKQIKAGRLASEEEVRRFRAEAQAAARLDHPGIVRVFEVGRHSGQDYFSQEFVPGESLADKLKRHEGPLPPREAAELVREIALAVAYAHEQGVIHRDLKPANVLLDREGRPRVTDFGLAKRLEAAEGMTVSGQVLGTPGYMPPEQATGGEAGPAADVYALGATLYTLLVGRPPFQADNIFETLRQTIEEEPVSPRHLNAAVPRDLETVCLKCLEKESAKRYAFAHELAADVARYLRTEPIVARRPTLMDRSGKWVRRHAPVVTTALASLLVLAAVGGITTAWYLTVRADQALAEQSRSDRADRLNDAVASALDEVEAKHNELYERLRSEGHVLLSEPNLGEELLEEAEAALARAQQLQANEPDLLLPAVEQRFRQLKEGLASERAESRHNWRAIRMLDDIRLSSATTVDGEWKPENAVPRYEQAFADLGLHLANGDANQLAEAVGNSRIKPALVAALDHWAATLLYENVQDRSLRPRLLEVARLTDPDPWRNRFRQSDSQENDLRLAAEVDPSHHAPHILEALAIQLGAEKLDAEGVLRRALLQYPRDFWLSYFLGQFSDEPAEKIAAYRVALAVRPQSNVVWAAMGDALKRQGKFAEANLAYHKSLAIDPQFADAWNSLGNLQRLQRQFSTAADAYRRAIEIEPRNARLQSNLGTALYGQGKVQEAIDTFENALRLSPDDPTIWYNLGYVFDGEGRTTEAIDALTKAARLDPHDANIQNNLSIALLRQGELPAAEDAGKNAVRIDPENSRNWFNLAKALSRQGKLQEAADAYRKGLKRAPQDSDAWNNLGTLLFEQALWSDAAAAFQCAIEIDADSALAHYNLGNALRGQNKPAEAVAAYGKALQINPRYPQAFCNLGLTLWQQGEFSEALGALEKGHELGSQDPKWAYPSHKWVSDCQQSVETDQLLNRIEQGEAEPEKAGELLALAHLCQKYKGSYRRAARFYLAAFKAEPRLTIDVSKKLRYLAACAAALAAAGQGNDGGDLTEEQRAELREQAAAWLYADLDAYTRLAGLDNRETQHFVAENLAHWRQNPDLASIRDPEKLGMLPQVERKQWQQFWNSVAVLQARLDERPASDPAKSTNPSDGAHSSNGSPPTH